MCIRDSFKGEFSMCLVSTTIGIVPVFVYQYSNSSNIQTSLILFTNSSLVLIMWQKNLENVYLLKQASLSVILLPIDSISRSLFRWNSV